MKLHAYVSAAALAAAMMIAGPAAAQNMIGDREIPVEQVQNFQQACEGLRAASTASLTTSNDQVEEPAADPTQTGSITPDPSASSSPADPASQENWDELLATLTAEECEAGGFFAAQ